MALNYKKYGVSHTKFLRDSREFPVRLADWAEEPENAAIVYIGTIVALFSFPQVVYFLDFIFALGVWYFLWLCNLPLKLPFKLPMSFRRYSFKGAKDAKGILYLGNHKETNRELWVNNEDARTHILYLGTTGAGKTEGLKSLVSNALCWASGFVFIDGKADTDMWSSLCALVRRFGRDDDLFVLNYMTGNSDERAPSNTMNPFSSGSASYLTNMLVSLMPAADGDNAMWKERAVSLIGSLMPVLTWKRDHLSMPLSISVIRKHLELSPIIRLSREEAVPPHLRESLEGYLKTLPGYVDASFDDDGNEKPPGPDTPMVDTQVVRQQHGYLSMQFTRSLQSLGDDYGYIFDTQNADVDMIDIVLNRRILVVLIPALEKSADETANLGKIVAASLKGMMGSTLGATVEGSSAAVIENKPTNFSSPFMTIFDEVGYYTTEGMAVMAAQARSLGFCLIYSAQDLPALEKRVKEEARSIAGNCNIRIFGKLTDPTTTKDFFKGSVGDALVTETSGFKMDDDSLFGGYHDTKSTGGLTVRDNASYESLFSFKPGQTIMCFGGDTVEAFIFYADPGKAKAMRVMRQLSFEAPEEAFTKQVGALTKLRDRMVAKSWTASNAAAAVEPIELINAVEEGFQKAITANLSASEAGTLAIAHAYVKTNQLNPEDVGSAKASSGGSAPASPLKETATDVSQKTPETVAANGAAKPEPEKAPSPKGSADWNALLGADEETENVKDLEDISKDDDEETEGSKGSAGDSRGQKMAAGDFDSQAAVDNFANSGEFTLPEGISDEVAGILEAAADNIRSGLFAKPEVEKKAPAQGAKATTPKGGM